MWIHVIIRLRSISWKSKPRQAGATISQLGGNPWVPVHFVWILDFARENLNISKNLASRGSIYTMLVAGSFNHPQEASMMAMDAVSWSSWHRKQRNRNPLGLFHTHGKNLCGVLWMCYSDTRPFASWTRITGCARMLTINIVLVRRYQKIHGSLRSIWPWNPAMGSSWSWIPMPPPSGGFGAASKNQSP